MNNMDACKIIDSKMVTNSHFNWQEPSDISRVLEYFKTNFSSSYNSAMQKVFANELDTGVELTEDEKGALISVHPKIMEYGVQVNPTPMDEDNYRMFLNYVENTSLNSTKMAQPSCEEYRKYRILGIEFYKKGIVEQYGQYVYLRASMEVPFEVKNQKDGTVQRNFKQASRKLCYLAGASGSSLPIIDLDLYRKYLEFKGIQTSVDYDSNIFVYGIPQECNNHAVGETAKSLEYVNLNR